MSAKPRRFLARVGLLAILLPAGCERDDSPPMPKPTRLEIWNEIREHTARYRIEPEFVYALVAAESNFNVRAANGEARGLLQIKPIAWNAVSQAPYEPGVWEWRQNLRVGIDYLALCRQTLHANGKFNYPRLLAAFHYGLHALEETGWNESKFDVPPNPIYRELWRGNPAPVPPPTGPRH